MKKVSHQCVLCYKFHARNCKQIMADLPSLHVIPAPTFQHYKMDYAGPFNTCLTIKAVHLEIVNDLTTDQFIATLNGFISRRGYPNSIHTDNGTNFVGTRNYLHLLYQLLYQTVF